MALVVAGYIARNCDWTYPDTGAVSDRSIGGRRHVTVGHFILVWKKPRPGGRLRREEEIREKWLLGSGSNV